MRPVAFTIAICALASTTAVADPVFSVEGALTEQAIEWLERLFSPGKGWSEGQPDWAETASVEECVFTFESTNRNGNGGIRRYTMSFNLGDLDMRGPWLNYPEYVIIWPLKDGTSSAAMVDETNASAQTQEQHLKRTGEACVDNRCISEWSDNMIDLNVRGYPILPPLNDIYEAFLHMNTVCKGTS